MSELTGVLIAIVSSCLGGTAAAVTRYLVGNADHTQFSGGIDCGLCRHLDRDHANGQGIIAPRPLATPLPIALGYPFD